MSFLPFKNHLELPDISLTLFVGQLPTDINDSYVRTLLELCGRMDSWKRIVDPVTNDQTAFGFVWFSEITSVCSALKLLNGFTIDSRSLIVKIDKSSELPLQEYQNEMPLQLKMAQEARDDAIRYQLKALSEERSGQHGGKQNDVSSWGELVGDEDGVEQNNIVMLEVQKFRKGQEEQNKASHRKRMEELKRKLHMEKQERLKEEEVAKKRKLSQDINNIAELVSMPKMDIAVAPVSRKRPEPVPLRRGASGEEVKVVIKGKKEKVAASSSTAASGFGVEEAVELKPQRELVPLVYTEAEKMNTASLEDRLASVSHRAKAEAQALVDQIPTSFKGLCDYKVDWSIVESRHLIQEKMTPWMSTRVKEYLGEADQTFIDFVLAQLRKKVHPRVLLDELQSVLDKDAETFIKLLWRKLIFEMLRAT